MKTFQEDDLVAYHLGELSRWKAMRLRRRLEHDPELAAHSEEIAATLRIFCCDPPPVVSEAKIERSWLRVRGSLSVLEPAPRPRRILAWAAAGAAAVVVLAALFTLHTLRPTPGVVTTASTAPSAPRSWTQKIADEIHAHRPVRPYNNRPGPLTVDPADAVAADPALAAHLDTAERVLTEVTHTDGPLQPETREQVHRLMLQNAVYHQSAEKHGDLATAAVIDDLGRVLISLDAEPQHDPDAFRVHMNLGGVLLDLRILHHSDSQNGQ